jgi:hypothetical protein
MSGHLVLLCVPERERERRGREDAERRTGREILSLVAGTKRGPDLPATSAPDQKALQKKDGPD